MRVYRKKRTLWDIPPHGYTNMTPAEFKTLRATGEIEVPVSTSTGTLPATTLPQGAQTTLQARRLYCGNIPLYITEDLLMRFFYQKMKEGNIVKKPGNPLLSCQMNFEKNFAFLEFRSIEETSLSMALDGIMCQGQALKIRRPTEYKAIPGLTDIPAAMIPGIVSTIVADTVNKVFIGGLPTCINEDQVKDLLSTFGDLRSFNLVKDSATRRAFAFCEYVDIAITDLAIAGMNGMYMGERALIVQRANKAESVVKRLTIPGVDLNEDIIPTNVLCLMNVISPEELEDDGDYQEIVEDIRTECSKYGHICSLLIPRPNPNFEIPSIGKIFVEYATPEEAKVASTALTGRKFSNKVVVTGYFDPETYSQSLAKRRRKPSLSA